MEIQPIPITTDNPCKQFGPKANKMSGLIWIQTDRHGWYSWKFFKIFKSADKKKVAKLPSMQRVNWQ